MSRPLDDESDEIRQARVIEWKEGRWSMLKHTLQGCVCKTEVSHGKRAIVKKAFAELVRTGRSLRGARVQENFLGERETLQYLQSFPDMPTGIVRLLHAWDDHEGDDGQGVHYYLQEFISGGDLFELTSNFWLSNPTAFELLSDRRRKQVLQHWHENVIDMFRQLVEAVSWMHSKGIIHLDISLENIMVEKEPRDPRLPIGFDNTRYSVRVIDFGTAQKRLDGNFTCTNFHVGKSAYMAPEVHDPKFKSFDGRAADTWSLGVVLFQMLVGSQLYQKASLSDPTLNYAMRQGIPALLRGWNRLDSFPTHACDLLSRIFKFQQTGRISMEEIWQHPFVRCAGNPPRGIWEEVADSEDVEMETLESKTEHERMHTESQPDVDVVVEEHHRGEGEPRALQFRSISVNVSEGTRLQAAMDQYGFTEDDMARFFERVDGKSREEFVQIVASFETLHRQDCSSMFTLITRGGGRDSERIRGNDILRFCVRKFSDPSTFEHIAQRLLFDTLGRASGVGILSREESDAPMIDAGDEEDRYDDRI